VRKGPEQVLTEIERGRQADKLEIRIPKFETNPNDQKAQIPNKLVLDCDF
jgi:hypothetical protein